MKVRNYLSLALVLGLLSTLIIGCQGTGTSAGVVNPIPGGGGGANVGGGVGGNAGNANAAVAAAAAQGNAAAGPTLAVVLNSLDNPTRLINFQGGMVALLGFNRGQSNGRLIGWLLDTVNNASPTGGPMPIIAQTAQGSPLQAIFTNPFDVISDPLDTVLFISDGFNTNNGGQILLVTPTNGTREVRVENLTRNTTQPQNPAFLLFIPPATLFYTEFNGVPNGLVRRINLTDLTNPTVVTFMNGLNFPADVATDGVNLFVAEAGNNRVLRVPLAQNAANLPLNPNSAGVVSIINDAAAQQMRQPFELVVDALGGVFVEEGMGLALGGLPPLGTANGQIQYIPAGQNAAFDVGTGAERLTGITNPSGLDVVNLSATTVAIFWTESVNTPNGAVRRVDYAIDINDVLTNTLVDTGLNSPFDVAVELDGFANIIEYTVDFQGGQNQGQVKRATFP